MYKYLQRGLISITTISSAFLLGKQYESKKHNKVGENTGLFRSNFLEGQSIIPIVEASAQPLSPNKSASVALTKTTNEALVRVGYPSLENLRSFDDFVLSYDRRNRTANWVFEHLTKEKLKHNEDIKRQEVFNEDDKVHPYFRSTNKDYKGSGYDRGHLAAAGNHKWSQSTMNQTFYLSNISPQVGKGFNRDAWNTLEKQVRHLVKNNKNVYVFTGPLYLPRKEEDGKVYVKYEVIGQNNVAVPTHFFKVVICESDPSEFQLLSFVMPNKVLPEKLDLRKYLVPIESIERASGFLLLNNIPKNKFKKINGIAVS